MLFVNMSSGLRSWWEDASSNKGDKHLTTFLAISITTFLVFCFFKKIKKSKRAISHQLPPGPPGLPVLGYLPFLGTRLHETFTELALVHGPIYKLRLGKKLCIVIGSPALMKEVVRDNDKIFANHDPPTSARIVSYGIGNDIAWSPYGRDWKKLRKVFVREMLSNSSLDACYSLRKQEVQKTIRHVYHRIGNPIDIGELAFMTNMNAIMSVLFGGTLEGEEGTKLATEFRNLTAELMVLHGKPNISDLFPVLARFDLQGIEREAQKISSGYDEFLNFAIGKCSNLIEANKSRAGRNDKKDFLQFLLELKDNNDPATSITTTQLKGLLLDIVGAASDTTSTMVEWTMAELMQQKDVMKMVQQELDEVVGINNIVEESHLPKLHYLEAVSKETFRLHPAVPLIPRSSSMSCTVGGYTIPKGCTIFLNVYAIQRDPQLWDNPLKFEPERFMNQEAGRFDFYGNNLQYLPFGSGRRICAGLPLAEKMLMYQLASLLHSFEWKLPDGTELELSDKFGIVIKKMKPLVAIPTPRLSNLDLYH